MFDFEKSIKKWLRKFRKHPAFNHGSVREMELHLRDHIDDLIANGYDEKKAFEFAVKQFGDISPIATEEHWNQHSKSIYNSLFFSSMFSNYFKIALRNFWKHKFYSFVNIIGLTMGLSIVFMIGLFVTDELSFDQFHAKKNELYRVVENQYYAEQPVFPVAVTPTALGPSLKEEYPEVVNFTRVSMQNYRFELQEKMISENEGIMVDEQFFEMFSFPLSQGSLELFNQNVNGLLLNEELAKKYFPDEDPVGKLIKLSGEEYVISGVLQEIPRNSHLSFRYVTNFLNYITKNQDKANSWGSNWLYTYVEVEPFTEINKVNDKIIGQIKANSEGSVTDVYLQPLSNIHLGGS